MFSRVYIDPELAVHKELPENGVSIRPASFGMDRFNARQDGKTEYYECRSCQGFIEGQAIQHGINDMGMLAGRNGTAYFCKRCGYEVDFFGKVS